MTAPRSFQLSARAKAKGQNKEYEPRPYVFVSASETEVVEVDGELVERPKEFRVVANYPGDGAISLFMAAMGTDVDEVDVLSTLFEFLKKAFNRNDYRTLRRLLREEELEYEQLMELIGDMVEGWLAFPTKPASASTGSRPQTGIRSTGRAPGQGSTLQTSHPVDS